MCSPCACALARTGALASWNVLVRVGASGVTIGTIWGDMGGWGSRGPGRGGQNNEGLKSRFRWSEESQQVNGVRSCTVTLQSASPVAAAPLASLDPPKDRWSTMNASLQRQNASVAHF